MDTRNFVIGLSQKGWHAQHATTINLHRSSPPTNVLVHQISWSTLLNMVAKRRADELYVSFRWQWKVLEGDTPTTLYYSTVAADAMSMGQGKAPRYDMTWKFVMAFTLILNNEAWTLMLIIMMTIYDNTIQWNTAIAFSFDSKWQSIWYSSIQNQQHIHSRQRHTIRKWNVSRSSYKNKTCVLGLAIYCTV
jgi:hypothetical protein